jgi:alkylhydroperoxidase family enzyme
MTARPRIPPLAAAEWTPEQREIMAPTLRDGGLGGQASNVLATLLHQPKLMKRWLVFANHCLFKSTLPVRDRELAILRTAWLARCEYEWAQHVVIARAAGITDDVIEALRGDAAQAFAGPEAALLAAVDELARDVTIGDATWQALSAHYRREQVMDLAFLVGQYRMLAGAIHAFGVRLDTGMAGF